MAEKQPTEKEIKELKEGMRAVALKNLNAPSILSLSTAYLAQADPGYGENDNSAVEEFLYKPNLRNARVYDIKTGEESDLVYDGLFGSRKDGKRYSGQISEDGIIRTAAAILQESLTAIKVEDLMDLAEVNFGELGIKKTYQNKYLSDLLESKNEEERKVAQALIGHYMQYVTTAGVSDALSHRVTQIRGGLEKLVSEEPKK